MKNPLRYQISEYDCGPTSLLNALSYLFEREEIPPEIIRNIMIYSLDSYGKDGISGKSGTSYMAMMFVSNWINGFGQIGQLNISSRYLSEHEVNMKEGGYIDDAIRRNGAVVLRLYEGGWHYVLCTDMKGDKVYLFDPYYDDRSYEMEGIEVILDQTFSYNRIVDKSYFDNLELGTYALGPIKKREAVIIYNEKTRIDDFAMIEYMI